MELPKPGDLLLGKYLLEAPLGEGGMGIVYAAQHQLLGQRVAVKFLRPEVTNRDAIARFHNEARAVARIDNEHVARVLDVGVLDEGLPYIVLEYLNGSDLANVLHTRGPLPVHEVVDYVLQGIEAVAHAHAIGIVHRDLKPANLFLDRRQDGSPRVKVLDFGISKATAAPGQSGNITKTHTMLGSPLYMSPEQLLDSKGVDHRCDIWALGVVTYELLTGEPPFNADNAVALFAAIQASTPASMGTLRHDVPMALDAAVLRCLQRNPNERFSSVTELAIALAPFGTPIAARALENTKRVLPPETVRGTVVAPAGSRPPPRQQTTEIAPRVVLSTSVNTGPGRPVPPSMIANTADPWTRSESRTGDQAAPAQRTPGALLAVIGVVLTGLVVVGLVFGGRMWSARKTAQVAATSAAPEPTATGGAPSASALPVVSAPSAAIAAPSASSSATAPATPPAPLAPPKLVVGGSPPPPPPAVPPASASAKRPVNCTPPFDLDPTGKKVWKRECL